jgi:hypothetical protein
MQKPVPLLLSHFTSAFFLPIFKIFENLSSSRPIPPFETQRSATIKIELYFLKLAETSTLANQERDPVSNQLHAR